MPCTRYLLFHLAHLALAAALASTAGVAFAGRPLNVDDANVNDPGAGQVEAWYARQPGHTPVWTLAPAWSPAQGIELGAAVARDTRADLTTRSIQAKFRFTPAKENGCNTGGVIGVAHTPGEGSTHYLNGLLSCNWAGTGALHTNLGYTRARGGPSLATWGMAWEQELGPVTAHVEVFGQRHDKPTMAFGARREVAPSVQLDGSIGRQNREWLYTLGLKFQF